MQAASTSLVVQPGPRLSQPGKHLDGPVGGSECTQQAGKRYGLFGSTHYRKRADRPLLMIGSDLGTHRKQLFATHGRVYCAAAQQLSVRKRPRCWQRIQ